MSLSGGGGTRGRTKSRDGEYPLEKDGEGGEPQEEVEEPSDVRFLA